MRSGPITEPFRVGWLVLPLMWLLAGGCERAPSGEQPHSTNGRASTTPPAPSGNQAGGAAMVLVPAGSFKMGDPNEVDAAPHEVNLGAFYLDKHLVTQEQFEKLMQDNPSRWKGAANSVEQVRWSDAVRFCNKRSEAEGLQPCYDLASWKCNFDANGYRLPTEAEFEYACRAGTTTPYLSGDTPARLAEFAWFDKNSGGHPLPVGQKQPNAWGLYDICGNLWEWCNDFYQVDYYGSAPKQDPRGPAEGKTKVVRGGCWRTSADNCRSGYRYNENPGYADVCFGYDIYGFRCARNASGSR
jgi:formylglycine-generating enzyme required for sulfatase activity